jgi:hypothetical protein
MTDALDTLDDVSTQLTAHADAIRALGKQTQHNIIEIGRHLTEARDEVGHGDWQFWLAREFNWSDRTALNFMRVYELSRKSEKFSDLSIPVSALYLLARPSTPDEVHEQVIKRAEAGERITVAAVKEVIERAATDLPTPPLENIPPAPVPSGPAPWHRVSKPHKPPREKPATEVWDKAAEAGEYHVELLVDLQRQMLADNKNATGELAKVIKAIGKLDIKLAHEIVQAAVKLGKELDDLSNKPKRHSRRDRAPPTGAAIPADLSIPGCLRRDRVRP